MLYFMCNSPTTSTQVRLQALLYPDYASEDNRTLLSGFVDSELVKQKQLQTPFVVYIQLILVI